MAVDTTQVQSIYTALNTSAQATLDVQWNDQRLRGADYANVVAQTITALLQTSAQLLEQQEQLTEQARQADANLAEQARQYDANLLEQQAELAEKAREFDTQLAQQATLEANNLAEQGRQADANIVEKGREFDAQLAQDAPVKTAQAALITQQKLTEIAYTALKKRQTTMYNDNLRVEEAKMLTNVVGMFGAGGTALPTGLETQMVNAINLVTP